jgi:hypothetical protein
MRFLASLFAIGVLTACGMKSSPEAGALDTFVAAGFDDVTVYSLDPIQIWSRNLPITEPDAKPAEPIIVPNFNGYPIRKQVTVDDAITGQKLASVTAKDMRSQLSSSKCFEPRHGLRVRKGTTYFDLVICYTCNNVEVYSPTHAGGTVAIASASESLLNEVLTTVKP